jgi:hypothetical protein
MMDAGDWVAVGGIAVAFIAVIASLLQDDLRRWLFPPKVEVSASVTIFYVPNEAAVYVPHAFVRLKLSTTATSAPAKGVLVSLVSCHPLPTIGGKVQVDAGEMLQPLRWAFEHVQALDLVPGAGRHLDLVEISGGHPAHAWLATTDAPRDGLVLNAHVEEYKIEVLIAGQNLRPKHQTVYLLHTGQWTGHDHPPDTVLSVRVSNK